MLKLPEIPSLLVETAYISNPKEEKLLRNRKFQTDLAEAISNSIIEFLSRPPSTAPAFELVKEEKIIPPVDDSEKQETLKTAHVDSRIHIVKKGDSLIQIALDYDIKVNKLLKLNDMKLKDNLYIGRKLKLTEPDEEPEEEPVAINKIAKAKTEPLNKTEVSIYRVKKGDSLDRIARKHDTTLNALLKLNNMKLKDPLYEGRLIKINQADVKETEVSKPFSPMKDNRLSVKAKKRVHFTYKVKKGDTIDIIARRHKISANAILSLNNMQRSDPLFVDQKLKLPHNPIP